MSTATRLAQKYGIRGRRKIYLYYYFPFLNWIRQYRWSYFQGDLIAAITMASFYIPMALSLASNLGHVPALNGLYAFVFNPFIYALLGTCPQMVVGPEAAGSLLTGQVVKESINRGDVNDEDGRRSAEVGGMVTFTAGFIILLGGVFRLGFLDNVLSRPFQRGFISAIGIVIFIDQLIPELGLNSKAAEVGGVLHGSCVDKMVFLLEYMGWAHGATTALSLGSFVIIMICRQTKSHLQPRYPSVAYIPDRFIIVVLSAFITYYFRLDLKGVDVLGNVHTGGAVFRVRWPYVPSTLKIASDAFSTAFVIALLGFFESSVAAKSLGTGEKTGSVIKNMHLSPNRELVALGTANVVGGLFMALPAFGGYGRSKVNASTGGKTPMSSVFLSLITLLSVLCLTPYFYYLPKGVLAAMISVVAWSLLEEMPEDLHFFIQIRGYSELLLMALIFLSTIFWNLKIGIAVGIGLSLLRVIHHATRPRIQILGRVPGTNDRFENAERQPGSLEFFEGCLIVKIPEPLTFANTGSLKARLRRLEDHGTGKAHPALPPIRRKEHNQTIIFDVHGVTSMDGAGTQVLRDIVEGYVKQDVQVVFCRPPPDGSRVWKLLESSGVVELCGGRENFVESVQAALALTEAEGSVLVRPEGDQDADGMA
ncbi:sulfate transporter [Microthyrium microscopicum]|uniref:Sulfate transporter n=1 Tax=Microthyrium microscopicum TaxID=703497 RepID=A0A6A6U884_9PEZI|nr:sulfate transporter [Microthyrium microscopicum]